MRATALAALVGAVALFAPGVGIDGGIARAQDAVGTAFVYQGRLKVNGELHTAAVDLCFSLYDHPDVGQGTLISGPLLKTNLTPSKGLFSAELDFGAGAFDGEARWLQIAVRSPAGGPANCVTGFTVLQQRQAVMPTPYAVHAAGPWESDATTGDAWYTAGAVGVGTVTPGVRLDTVGNTQLGSNPNVVARFRANDGGDGVVIGSLNGNAPYIGDHNAGSSVGLDFRTGGQIRMRVSQSGDIGIGTPSPLATLDVAGSLRATSGTFTNGLTVQGNTDVELQTGALTIRRIDTPSMRLYMGYHLGNYAYLQAQQDGGSFGNLSLNFLGGNVGIGTNAPVAAKLVISGNVCYTGAIFGCSDRRFKKNVESVRDGLALVNELQGLRFDWRTNEFPERNFPPERQIGLIAQDVERVVPEVVRLHSDGYYSVDYTRLTPVLVEAIKELHGIVKDKDAELAVERAVNQQQQATIEQQQSRLDALSARLASMERILSDRETGP